MWKKVRPLGGINGLKRAKRSVALSLALIAALAGQTLAAAPLSAQESAAPHPLSWPEHYRKFSLLEGAFTTAALATVLTLNFAPVGSEGARWHGALPGFDTGPRYLLYARGDRGRKAADLTSDILLGTLLGYSLLVDPLIVTGAARGQWESSLQMSLINAQAVIFTELVTLSLKLLTARERPFVKRCAGEGRGPNCEDEAPYRSFPSGHTSQAFVAAGLTCLHHDAFPIYGDRRADRGACFSSLSLAALTGLMRIVADKHHTSDVLIGAGIGLLFGYVVPKWLHFSAQARTEAAPVGSSARSVVPGAQGTLFGASYVGLW